MFWMQGTLVIEQGEACRNPFQVAGGSLMEACRREISIAGTAVRVRRVSKREAANSRGRVAGEEVTQDSSWEVAGEANRGLSLQGGWPWVTPSTHIHRGGEAVRRPPLVASGGKWVFGVLL